VTPYYCTGEECVYDVKKKMKHPLRSKSWKRKKKYRRYEHRWRRISLTTSFSLFDKSLLNSSSKNCIKHMKTDPPIKSKTSGQHWHNKLFIAELQLSEGYMSVLRENFSPVQKPLLQQIAHQRVGEEFHLRLACPHRRSNPLHFPKGKCHHCPNFH